MFGPTGVTETFSPPSDADSHPVKITEAMIDKQNNKWNFILR